MDFIILGDTDGNINNPYAGKRGENWVEGTVSAEYLQEHYGTCEDLDECILTTESEGLKLFFEYLKTQL